MKNNVGWTKEEIKVIYTWRVYFLDDQRVIEVVLEREMLSFEEWDWK